ncbi:MAG: hypothetical protein ABTQ34_00785 [Bdellovibrionales bacterium]
MSGQIGNLDEIVDACVEFAQAILVVVRRRRATEKPRYTSKAIFEGGQAQQSIFLDRSLYRYIPFFPDQEFPHAEVEKCAKLLYAIPEFRDEIVYDANGNKIKLDYKGFLRSVFRHLWPVLRELLRNKENTRLSKRLVAKEYRRYILMVATQGKVGRITVTHSKTYVIPLFNFVFEGNDLHLSDGCRIGVFSDEDKNRNSDLLEQCSELKRYILPMLAQARSALYLPSGGPKDEEYACCTLTCLRLIGPNTQVSTSGLYCFDESIWPENYFLPMDNYGLSLKKFISINSLIFSDNNRGSFIDVFGKLYSNDFELYKKLSFCLKRFNIAFTRDTPEDILVDLVIALESLLLDDGSKGEIVYKFSLRGAVLCGCVNMSPNIYDDLKILYDIRSSIVHSGKHLSDLSCKYNKHHKFKSDQEYVDSVFRLCASIIKLAIDLCSGDGTHSKISKLIDGKILKAS